MADPFLGELRLIAWDRSTPGWAQCNGQLLPINQNQALFSLLGTAFGGDGKTTFALPDLRGRTPVHTGVGRLVGNKVGEVVHTLDDAEIPTHTHALSGSGLDATVDLPDNNLVFAKATVDM